MSEPSLDRDPVEVLAEEFLQRRRQGEPVSIEEYVHRHPQLAERIQKVFSTALWLEAIREQNPQPVEAALAHEEQGDFVGKRGEPLKGPSEVSIDRLSPSHPQADQEASAGPACFGASPDTENTYMSETLPFRRLGDFRIIREIGRGGMGIVYEAEQETLGRRVAVKVLPSIHLSSPSAVRRFHREAKAAARLHHTNIIPVFGVGQQEGIHYYVMQYIRGVSLDEVLTELSAHFLASPSSASTVLAKKPVGTPEQALPTSQLVSSSAETEPETKATRQELRELVQLLLAGGFAPSAGLTPQVRKTTESSGTLPVIRALAGEGPGSHSATGTASVGSATCSLGGGQGPSGESSMLDWSDVLGQPPRLPAGYWRSVAGIGLQVANALHYAHQQGALHRDIKPGNLLLDAEGRVWVADFGLAKLLDQEELTRSGDVVGTLRYMAPEQWEGRADARTDVYGLGLTLYEMLVLRPAFDETDRARLIRQVMHEDPVPPRRLQPDVPRDLETIVLKAIARQPTERYQTAAEFAEDLERFLEDRPVRARRVSSLERLWRWCRRNKLVAALSAAVVGLLAVVAVVASVGYVRTSAALRRESFQRAQAEAARKLADAERTRAELQRYKAETEYARAEANLRLAIQAFEDIFHRIVAEPVFQPHPPTREESEPEELQPTEEPWEVYGWTSTLTEKDAAVVQTMLAFYDRFAQQNADNRALQRETAQAYRRMGEIHLRLGNYEEAEKSLLKARTIYAQIAADITSEPSFRLEQAMVENRLGNLYWFTARWPQAIQSYKTARQLLAEAPAEVAQTPACRLELARSYAALGRALSWRWPGRRAGRKPTPPSVSSPPTPPQQELPDPVACYQQAVRLLEQLVEQSHQHPEYRLTLARTYRELATFAGRRLPAEEVAKTRQKALELVEKLVADFPANPDYRFELAETYAAIARASAPFPPNSEERRRLQEALRIETELVAQYPHVPDYQAALARLYTEVARWEASSGQWTEAEKHLRQALNLQQTLAERFPSQLPYQIELARQTVLLHGLLQAQGKKQEQRKLLDEAIQRAEKRLQDADRGMLVRGFLAWAYAAQADLLQNLGQTDQAAQARRKAEQIRPKDATGPRIPWWPGGPWPIPRPRPHEPPNPKDLPPPKSSPSPKPRPAERHS
ncbi:MAG: protein kinase [Thermoguttaceae bacterium]|nr:protein kinase [Thermoguttaceae bacterium]MDW8036984.1 protein kinase [Thermoguttaceae bacterium]